MLEKYTVQPINYLFKRTVDGNDEISSEYFICKFSEVGNFQLVTISKEEIYKLVKLESESDRLRIESAINDNNTIIGYSAAREFVDWLNENAK